MNLKESRLGERGWSKRIAIILRDSRRTEKLSSSLVATWRSDYPNSAQGWKVA